MKANIHRYLNELGFQRIGTMKARELFLERKLEPHPAVYVATLMSDVFWVGETGNIRARMNQYRRWLALPDDSMRRDIKTRNDLLGMTKGEELVLFMKQPLQVSSYLTQQDYPGHRVEEVMLIDYFKPAWNFRPGGRRRG